MADRDRGNEIGYGKPPEKTRFAKGQSGNPRGRPKGAKNLSTILQQVGRERVTVNINGRTVQMTKLEASTHQLANRAASGDLKAIRELFYWCRIFQEPDQDSWSVSSLDEKDKPVMESILRRLRQVDSPEAGVDPVAQNTSERKEEK